ncbi:hypothetical protein LTR53_017233 [Teratosphaeriaceae sp. CCFEE 6253]|nr:hypothetical protein LTR53_017233 [Teratosphaeriaceae sp. CCFEE 6253]
MHTVDLLMLALVPYTLAICRCNHYDLTATDPAPSNHAVFTEYLATDFTQPNASLTWTSAPGADWQAQAYNVTPTAARGPYGKAAELSNVVLGGYGGEGLQLWVRSQPLVDMIPIAEVVTARTDILYGSFRVSMKTTAVNGTCGAFFFYHDDSQEIDMEFLSRQQQSKQHVLNLVLQSPASVSAGDDAAGTPSFVPYQLSLDPTADFHEYRFDWLPGRVDMYADGVWLHSFSSNTSGRVVPDSPGAIHLIHWSNGDPGWSGGPPAQDAALEVQWARAWFNTSSSGGEDDDDCADDPPDCTIPPLGGPPAPAQVSASGTATATATATGPASTPSHSGSTRYSSAALSISAAVVLVYMISLVQLAR